MASSRSGMIRNHLAARLLKMGKMIDQVAPAWNRADPHKLPVLCISQPTRWKARASQRESREGSSAVTV
jgi:hypothetical protein